MSKGYIIGLFILMGFSVFGQNLSDTIEVRKKIATVFLQHGKYLQPREMLTIMAFNKDAYNEMKVANKYLLTGGIMAGGLGVGHLMSALIFTISGEKVSWVLVSMGVGFIVASIPFTKIGVKHAKKAVALYNAELKQTGFHNPELKFGANSGGIGLTFHF